MSLSFFIPPNESTHSSNKFSAYITITLILYQKGHLNLESPTSLQDYVSNVMYVQSKVLMDQVIYDIT